MHNTIADIHGLHHSDPIFYTQKYLNNSYVKANHLAQHLHVFNQPVSRIDYAALGELKGQIHTLKEVRKEQTLDGAIRSEQTDITQTLYTFNEDLELVRQETERKGSAEHVLLAESLKKPTRIQVSKFLDGTLSSQTEIWLNDFLEYQQIEEETFYNSQKSTWKPDGHKTTKYGLKEGAVVQKIHTRNNREEQSRSVTTYNDNFQIQELKAYDQKNKSEILYETLFLYNEKNMLNQIIYNRYKSPNNLAGNWTQKLNFEYDPNGQLIRFTDHLSVTTWAYDQHGNPVSQKDYDHNGKIRFEKQNTYRYDPNGNWTFKEMDQFRFDNSQKVKINHTAWDRDYVYFP